MLGGSTLVVILRELFGSGGGPVANLFPKIAGLVQNLDAKNFSLVGLRLLIWNQVIADGNSGATPTTDWTRGSQHTVTLNAAATFTFTSPSGVANLRLKLVQDGVGSRTATWPASVKWPGGAAPTLTTAAGGVDIVSFFFDGTTYWGVAGLGFA